VSKDRLRRNGSRVTEIVEANRFHVEERLVVLIENGGAKRETRVVHDKRIVETIQAKIVEAPYWLGRHCGSSGERHNIAAGCCVKPRSVLKVISHDGSMVSLSL